MLFGILAFAWPGITLFVLVLFFGAYMLVDGIFAIVAAVRAAGRESIRALARSEGRSYSPAWTAEPSCSPQ
jgi:uncharacterized membrane protein HdeD (DUF308 family)